MERKTKRKRAKKEPGIKPPVVPVIPRKKPEIEPGPEKELPFVPAPEKPEREPKIWPGEEE